VLITIANSTQTIRWFEVQDQQHEIICVLLTANPKHRAVLKDLIHNFFDTDAALGSRVGLLVVSGAEVSEGGRAFFLPGEFLGDPVIPLRDVMRHIGIWERGPVTAEMLAQSSVRAVDDWLTLIKLSRSELPALCVLLKGADPVIISLGAELATETLLKVLGQLADIAQREIQPAAERANRVSELLKAAEQAEKRCESLIRVLTQMLEAVCNRFKATARERQAVVQFLASGRFDQEKLEALFAQLAFSRSEGFARSATVRGIKNKVKQICKAREQLLSTLPTNDQVDELKDALRRFEARRDQTRALVSGLIVQGVDAKDARVDREGIFKGVKSATDVASLIEKAAHALRWVKDVDWTRVLS